MDEALDEALGRAYRYLGHRDRTATEMRTHLLAKGVRESVVDVALAELSEQGYIDDARFALRFAADRRTLDAWGAERVERRLSALGVAPEHVAAALAQGAEGELAAAVALLRRRFTTPPDSERERQRALGLLVRKGYELELAYEAVRALEREPA